MISAVSNVNFGNTGIDLSAPGKFSIAPHPNYSVEEPKSGKKGLKTVLALAVIALGGFIGLGYAVKNGKLAKSTEIPEGFFKKSWTKIKDFGFTIGESGQSFIERVQGWFGKKAKN